MDICPHCGNTTGRTGGNYHCTSCLKRVPSMSIGNKKTEEEIDKLSITEKGKKKLKEELKKKS